VCLFASLNTVRGRQATFDAAYSAPTAIHDVERYNVRYTIGANPFVLALWNTATFDAASSAPSAIDDVELYKI